MAPKAAIATLPVLTADMIADAVVIGRKTDANKTRISELQARELEKSAHLRTDHVDPAEINLTTDHLKRVDHGDLSAVADQYRRRRVRESCAHARIRQSERNWINPRRVDNRS